MSRILLATTELRCLRHPDKRATRKDVAGVSLEHRNAAGHGKHLTLNPKNWDWGGIVLHSALLRVLKVGFNPYMHTSLSVCVGGWGGERTSKHRGINGVTYGESRK